MTLLYLEAVFYQCIIIQLSNMYFLNWMAFNNWTLYLKIIKLSGSGGGLYFSSLAWNLVLFEYLNLNSFVF